MITPFKPILILFCALSSVSLLAQNFTQTIRGTIVDKVTNTALPGASIILLNSDPLLGATTDPEGNFKLSKVPVGTHALKISFVGYKEQIIPNVVVNSGKEVVLQLAVEEDITKMDEIIVTADNTLEKNLPINDMAVVSARTFSVEETRKFAAAVNDPSRMVTSFAGVVATNDGNNAISIRGNSPFGLLWRMEGVDIPNPNHFANVGTSGGGISILSSQLLSNSDFMTGAFAAEYGNALAGVFDLNLRKGNNEKREYTVQASFLGTDVAVEGPFSSNYRGSYLINYRYSTLSILDRIGLDVGDGVTNFQDISFNFFLPTRRFGNFSLFGFGGLSNQKLSAEADSSLWEDDFDRYNVNYFSNTGAAGIKHAINLGTRTYLQSAIVLSGNENGIEEDRLDDNYLAQFSYRQQYINKKITVSTVVNHKVNAQHSLRSGLYLNRYFFNLNQRDFNMEDNIIEERLNADGALNTIQAFAQWNYRMTEQLTFNGGLHFLRLQRNQRNSIEPRASVKYNLSEEQALSFGYGLHSQMQPVGVYEAQVLQPDGSFVKPNEQLDFNKAHHWVLGYDRLLTRYMRVKAEAYYQNLFDLAVKNDPASPVATIVMEEGYLTDPLVNKGRGRNYGVELTVEQFMHNDMYFLLSTSLYNSEYRALDGIWRSTRFNGNHAISFTAGKEYHWKKNRTFGVNIRTIWSGGFRTTPIDIEKSVKNGETEYIEPLSFSEQLPDYFRADLRLSLKRNRAKSTSTFSLDFQNVTNHRNLGGTYFDAKSGKVKNWYQLSLLPVFSYRIEF